MYLPSNQFAINSSWLFEQAILLCAGTQSAGQQPREKVLLFGR